MHLRCCTIDVFQCLPGEIYVIARITLYFLKAHCSKWHLHLFKENIFLTCSCFVLVFRWRHTHINLSRITYSVNLCLRACLFPFHFTVFNQYAHLFAEKKKTIPVMLVGQSKYSCLILSSICHPQQLAYMTALPFSC